MFENILDKIQGKASAGTTKVREILNTTPKGTTLNVSQLARESGAQRKSISNLIKKEYPNQFNILERSEASKQVQQKLAEKRAATPVTKPTVVAEKGKFTDVRFPSEEIKQQYLEDLKIKKSFPKSSIQAKEYSNKALAKKYFGDERKAFQIERINEVLSKQESLDYVKGSPSQSYITRQSRKAESQKYLSDFEKDVLKKQEIKKSTLNEYYKNNPSQVLKNKDLKNLIDVKLVDGKIELKPRYKTANEYKELAKQGKLFDEFDVSPVRGEKRSIQYPYNKNIAPGKFNQGFIRQVDSYYEKTKGDTSKQVQLNKKRIENFLKKYGYRVEIPGEGYIGAKALPAINRQTGALPNIERTLNKIGVSSVSSQAPKMYSGMPVDAMYDIGKTMVTKDLPAIGRGITKYGSPVLKTAGKALGILAAPMAAYDIGTAIEEGYSLPEVLERGLLGTEIATAIKEQMALSPEARAAGQVVSRAQAAEDPMYGWTIDAPNATEVEQAQGIYNLGLQQAKQQLEQERADRVRRIAERGLASLENEYGGIYGP